MNHTLDQLIKELDAAEAAWVVAGDAWEEDSTIEAHADALIEAEKHYNKTAGTLARWVSLSRRIGYRLCREEE